MTEFLTAVAGGLVAASFYITYGLGLGIVYRVTGVLNFAHGAVGAVAAYVAYTLLNHSVPYAAAAVLAIICGMVIAAATHVGIVRWLPSRSPEIVGVATLGVLIVVEGILLAIYGGEAKSLPLPLASSKLFNIGHYEVQSTTLLDVAAAVVVACGLAALMYRTRYGLAARAVSEGSHTAAMFGLSVSRVHAMVWAAGGALAAITALLVIPSYYLTPDFMTSYLIATFVAVVLGGFERIAGVVIGALAYGLLQNVFAVYVTGRLSNTISFAVILVVLIFLPYGLLGRPLPHIVEPVIPRRAGAALRHLRSRGRDSARLPRKAVPGGRTRLPAQAVFVGPVLIVALALVAGHVVGTSDLDLFTSIGAMFIAVLGMDLIYGYTGQLSIGQSGFMLTGAYVEVLLQTKEHMPFLLALVVAMCCGAIGGVLFGLPAARLRGVYLAVLTLAFAQAAPEIIDYFPSHTGGDIGIAAVVPGWLRSSGPKPFALFSFVVVLAGLVALAVIVLGRSQQGRSWKAVSDSDLAAAACGIHVVRVRVFSFAAGSALSSLSGALLASTTGYLSPSSFTLWTSIYLVVAVVIGGRRSTFGALLGAAFIVSVPYESSSIPSFANLFLGAAVLVVLVARPDGIKSVLTSLVSGAVRYLGTLRQQGGSSDGISPGMPAISPSRRTGGSANAPE